MFSKENPARLQDAKAVLDELGVARIRRELDAAEVGMPISGIRGISGVPQLPRGLLNYWKQHVDSSSARPSLKHVSRIKKTLTRIMPPFSSPHRR